MDSHLWHNPLYLIREGERARQVRSWRRLRFFLISRQPGVSAQLLSIKVPEVYYTMSRLATRDRFSRQGIFWIFFLAIVLSVSGCVPSGRKADEVVYYFSSKKLGSNEEKAQAMKLIRDLNAQSAGENKTQPFLENLYSGLHIRDLRDLGPQDYDKYRQYLDFDGSSVYVIIHPGFYSFFNRALVDFSSPVDRGRLPARNIVEKLYEKMSFNDDPLQIMQEQEIVLRDFIKVMSARRRLLLLIVPGGDYREKFTYGYSQGFDEYVRYINELAGGADSVVYLPSVDFNSGGLDGQGKDAVDRFLKAVKVKNVLIGGGFVGRCTESFAKSLREVFPEENMYLIPEIMSVSDFDIGGAFGGNLLTKEGKLNFREFADNLRYEDAYNGKNSVSRLRQLYIYELEKETLRLVSQPRAPKKPAK